ncbi:hypothetical protein OV079_15565 [Nannocystis pusilla]|uniref:Uncharacterized protein n=1 Tax=Nannocystis pusilla TaxID=889268 RepID=A0A9X3EWP0_9BACT|nr:hypothetical protein [Nannocystis pusilla]MCY1006948.1 hypothetical protein [Nannocystis pusilla]
MRTRRPWAALTLLLACTPQDGGDTDATTAAVTDSTPGTDSTASSDATGTATTGPTSTGDEPPTGTTTEPPATTSTTTDDPTAPTGTTTETGGDGLHGLVLEDTFEDGILNGWVRVERWFDPDPFFIQEDRFDLDQRAHQTGQRLEFFGNDPVPHSGRFCCTTRPAGTTAPSRRCCWRTAPTTRPTARGPTPARAATSAAVSRPAPTSA